MTDPKPRVLAFGEPAISAARDVIMDAGIVAVPTETVYGLAADATRADAVARIYAAKGRPDFNPLIVHVADLAAASGIAVFDEPALALARAWWPGPLTLVLPLRPGGPIAAAVTAGLDTVALRVPAHRAMRALIAATGRPLAAPSANRSGAISPTTAAHVVASLGDRVPLVIDDGACAAGLESTILKVADGHARVLRPGPIGADLLGAQTAPTGGPIVAPGQLASHYAPAKPLRLDATQARGDEYLIGFGPVAGDETLSASGELAQAAANLFAALHRADASPRARIAVAPIPRHGIGAAIADRLARAATR